MSVILQSSVIPYRQGEAGLEFALITSRTTGRWIVPKGGVEKNMTPWASAAKEALEEAGLLGTPGERSLGNYTYSKWDSEYWVEIYPFRVTEALADWEEKAFRKREWVSGTEAVERLTDPAVAEAIAFLISLETWPDDLP